MPTLPDLWAELVDGRVGLVEIRRPPRNYVDGELLAELAKHADQLVYDGARVVVVCSVGRHFSAGVDHGRGPRAPDAGERFIEAVRSVFAIRVPIVAAVQGAAVGGGLGLACAADFRVAAAKARFIPSFSKLGIHPGFGLTRTLPRLVGEHRAAMMLLLGDEVDATEALSTGLCDRVVPDEDLRGAAIQLAGELASRAPLAIASIRSESRQRLLDDLDLVLSTELNEQNRLRATQDFEEGVLAVRERRQGRFEGR